MSGCFTLNNVAHRKRLPGVCACGKADRRPGESDCSTCHALANRIYRARAANKRADAERKALAAMARGETPSIEGVSGQDDGTTKNQQRAGQNGKGKTETASAR